VGKPTSFERGWALRWVRGSIGSYGVSPEDVRAVVSSLLSDPLLDVPRELREERIRPLMDFLKQLEGGGSGG